MSFGVEISGGAFPVADAYIANATNVNCTNLSANETQINNMEVNTYLQVYDPVAYSESTQAISLDDSLTVLNPGTNSNMSLTLAAGQLNQMKTISIVSSSFNDNNTGTVEITLTDNYTNGGINYPSVITLGPNVSGESISYVTLLFSISAVNNWLIISSNNATWTYTSNI